MAKNVKLARNINRSVERELWARAAGRCQFNGCNRLIFKSPVTKESVNISETAHIYSFSESGPRGWGPLGNNPKKLNEVNNLMLVCHDCHKKIDKEKNGGRYPADLLIQWKEEHENRIRIVTGINPQKSSYVVLYGANIGSEKSPLQPDHANWSLFPNFYPKNERPICLAMTWEGRDDQINYWKTEEQNLKDGFNQKILPLIETGCHFSIFGFAPIPLLIKLGSLFTDKIPAQVYQLHREPAQTWQWQNEAPELIYRVRIPKKTGGPPALIVALSSHVDHQRITSVLGEDVSIWELTIDNPNNDFLKTQNYLSKFRTSIRELMVQISEKHGNQTPLSIFPSMPVSAAIELGRVRMPKADMPWILYDQNNKAGAFIKTININ